MREDVVGPAEQLRFGHPDECRQRRIDREDPSLGRHERLADRRELEGEAEELRGLVEAVGRGALADHGGEHGEAAGHPFEVDRVRLAADDDRLTVGPQAVVLEHRGRRVGDQPGDAGAGLGRDEVERRAASGVGWRRQGEERGERVVGLEDHAVAVHHHRVGGGVHRPEDLLGFIGNAPVGLGHDWFLRASLVDESGTGGESYPVQGTPGRGAAGHPGVLIDGSSSTGDDAHDPGPVPDSVALPRARRYGPGSSSFRPGPRGSPGPPPAPRRCGRRSRRR